MLPGWRFIGLTLLYYCYSRFVPISRWLGSSATLGLCKSHLRVHASVSGSTYLDGGVWDWCRLECVPSHPRDVVRISQAGVCPLPRGLQLELTHPWFILLFRELGMGLPLDCILPLWLGASLDCILSPEDGMGLRLLEVCVVLSWCPVGWWCTGLSVGGPLNMGVPLDLSPLFPFFIISPICSYVLSFTFLGWWTIGLALAPVHFFLSF